MTRLLPAAALAALVAACSAQPNGDGAAENASANAAVANVAAVEAAPAPAKPKSEAKAFADGIASTLSYEMTAGNLAQAQGGSDKIKAYGKRIFDDSVQAMMALKAASAKTPDVVLLDPSLTPEQLARIEALKDKTGAAFDAEFRKQVVAVHDKVLAEMMSYGESGKSPLLKTFAADGSARQRTHLYRGREL